jgi:hypothetical protein
MCILASMAFSIKLGVYIQDEEAEYGNMCIRSVRVKDVQNNSIASNFIRKGDFILSISIASICNLDMVKIQTVDIPSGNNSSNDGDVDIRWNSRQISTSKALGFINRYGILDTNKLINKLSSASYGENFEIILLRDGRFWYYSITYE